MRSRADSLAWGAAGLAVLLAIGAAAYRIVCSPAGIVILQDSEAPWIMVDAPVTARIQQWRRPTTPRASFSRTFRLDVPPERAQLGLRAFGEARVFLNERPVGFDADPATRAADWKRVRRTEVGALLREGENTLRVEVANRRGPALLALRLENDALLLTTGAGWSGRVDDEAPRPAIVASDVRPHPSSSAGERPLAALARVWSTVVALLATSAAAFLIVRWRAGVGPPGRLPAAAAGTVGIAWVALFALKLRHLDLGVGFDAWSHLEYLWRLGREARIPLATEHYSAYHPPLFYLASLAVDAAAQSLGAARAHPVALKLVPFVSGLGTVAVAALLTRRLLPGDLRAQSLAILFAGFLPVNLYVAAYFSNEGLCALLAGVGLLLAVGMLQDGEASPRRLAVLSLVLGAALLTKFTALLVAGPVLLALLLMILVVERTHPRRAIGRVVALLVPLLAVAGWFYARNVIEYGRPFVGNWDLPDPRMAWWSPPGFHTPGYYLRFGESLVRPFYAGFVSFWDALYSTLWGDGFLGGRAGVGARHPHWNYQFIALGYALALPATALLVAGFVWTLRGAWRDPEPGRRAAFGLLLLISAAMGFAIFWATLALPYHGQARASYLLALTPVWAFFFAWATSGLDGWLAARGGTTARTLLVAWLGALFGVLYLGFAG